MRLAIAPRQFGAIGLVGRPRMPATLRQPVPLETEERGPQGAPGPSGDFGYIRYGEMMGATTVAMPASTDTPFVVRSPRLVTDNLKRPFAGFGFFDADSILRCRAAGDSYLLSIRLTVTPQLIGGYFALGISIAGNVSGLIGPTSSRQVALSGAAGQDYRFDEVFQVFPSSGFAANGATIVMRSSVPVVLSNDVLFITPVAAAP